METAVRWSLLSTASDPQFLIADVIGKSFKHCRVTEYKGQRLQWEEIARNTKVPAFRAFDWSPRNNVVAVGQWSGETTVLGLGTAAQTISLPIRSQRQCNAVAFNSTSLLATGLERVRNDFCLNVYDINHRATGHSFSGISSKQIIDPVRKLATSEGITSIKYFPQQPNNLVAGVKGTCVRMYDLRENTGNPVLQFQTVCVHNVAMNPLDENYFASAGPPKDTTVIVWDRRSALRPSTASNSFGSGSSIQDGPVLDLKNPLGSEENNEHASIWSLRFSHTERGCLGILGNNGQFRIYDTKYVSRDDGFPRSSQATNEETPPYAPELYIGRAETAENSFNPRRRGSRENHNEAVSRIVSFDFPNMLTSRHKPCALLLRGNQDVTIYELKGPPPGLAVSAKSIIGTSHPASQRVLSNPSNEFQGAILLQYPVVDEPISEILLDIYNENQVKAKKVQRKAPKKGRKSSFNTKSGPDPTESAPSNFDNVLLVIDVGRRRCLEGYLFDCDKNCNILKDAPDLQELWTWVSFAQYNASDNGMISQRWDLSYLGVDCIWNNDIGSTRKSEIVSSAEVDNTAHSAIAALAQGLRSARVLFSIPPSKPDNRLVCLFSLGFHMDAEDLGSLVKTLVNENQNTEACLLALMCGDRGLAFGALRDGRRRDELSTLCMVISAFSTKSINELARQQISDVMAGNDDPFTKAILAYVTTSVWSNVLRIESLCVKYRIGVALMCLEDEELTEFIRLETTKAVDSGSVDGIVLTGLDHHAVDLFEAYIKKTGDLQTAVLVLSFAAPRFIRDPRFDAWRESYRSQLNSWRLFIERAMFDMGSTKLSVTSSGVKTIGPVSRQVSIRCDKCNEPLQRESEADSMMAYSGAQGRIFGDAKSSTICPKCSSHLPRCSICDHWLGVADPNTRGGQSTEKAREDPFFWHAEVCFTCDHMYHRGHADAWFSRHEECPVPDCECLCNSLDSARGEWQT